ncbi:Ribose-5-phosphate isomerase [Pseudocercospora fuligena]|uniref:Ribose-5-phosphate isomerase n=1 Tax=Pseudocercospora fuligena TaxID=685502 RepID=A0A8H6R9Y0_9PEZI|nr:Ribose-5-phosphate isomerase [Pseudocercospora fuligena]
MLKTSTRCFTSTFPRGIISTFQIVSKRPLSMATDAEVAAAAVAKVEAAKRKAAYKAVEEHFRSDMRFVGIGSGSTIVYGVEAIKDHLAKHPPPPGHINWFVPTGWNSRKVIEKAGLTPIAFDSLPAEALLEVAFDGADEVDEELNCIKGGGACLFQEKLVACRAKKFICIADYRKNQSRLLTVWPTIPIEIAPIAHASVIRELKLLGSPAPILREHTLSKTGPVQTDQSFYIVDAPFKTLLTGLDVKNGQDGSGKDGVWEVETLSARIKAIAGVLEVGIFAGPNGIQTQKAGKQGGQKPVAAYFGLESGEVYVKRYSELES